MGCAECAQAADVAAVALDNVNQVVRVAVLPEQHIGIVDLVLLRAWPAGKLNLFR